MAQPYGGYLADENGIVHHTIYCLEVDGPCDVVERPSGGKEICSTCMMTIICNI